MFPTLSWFGPLRLLSIPLSQVGQLLLWIEGEGKGSRVTPVCRSRTMLFKLKHLLSLNTGHPHFITLHLPEVVEGLVREEVLFVGREERPKKFKEKEKNHSRNSHTLKKKSQWLPVFVRSRGAMDFKMEGGVADKK